MWQKLHMRDIVWSPYQNTPLYCFSKPRERERMIESITKTQKNYWIPWERGLRAVFCYVFVASYLYCSCALHVSVWSMRVVRLPGHCFLRVERHTFETLILNILLTLWKNIARVQNCPDITILRRSSISSTYSGQSVRPWYFRISILSASLSPHKRLRWHCGGQHGRRHGGGHCGRYRDGQGGRHGGRQGDPPPPTPWPPPDTRSDLILPSSSCCFRTVPTQPECNKIFEKPFNIIFDKISCCLWFLLLALLSLPVPAESAAAKAKATSSAPENFVPNSMPGEGLVGGWQEKVWRYSAMPSRLYWAKLPHTKRSTFRKSQMEEGFFAKGELGKLSY